MLELKRRALAASPRLTTRAKRREVRRAKPSARARSLFANRTPRASLASTFGLLAARVSTLQHAPVDARVDGP
jgi:hypothetical protein